MLDQNTLQALGCWKGSRLERVQWPQRESRTLGLHLKPSGKVMRCEQCGSRCHQVHETTVRRVRDLPIFEYRVVLHVPRRRVICEFCGGPRLEKLDCLGRYQRVTQRFAEACEKLLRASCVQAVAEFFELGWHIRSSQLTRWVCKPGFLSPTGQALSTWRWMSLPCTRAIAMPRWWWIR